MLTQFINDVKILTQSNMLFIYLFVYYTKLFILKACSKALYINLLSNTIFKPDTDWMLLKSDIS